MNKIILGDCLIAHEEIESESVDLVLSDLPYGNMKGITNFSTSSEFDWDIAIEPAKVFEVANRILRKNGKAIFFSQEPYTTKLISEAIPNLPFCYRMCWEKDNFANPLSAKKAPVNYFEDILVFSKNNQVYDNQLAHPLRPYAKKVFEFIGITKKQIFAVVGTEADHFFRFNSTQFSLCTEETYNKLIVVYNIDDMPEFMTYEAMQEINVPYRTELAQKANNRFPSVFNLWEGKKYKGNILKYKKDYDGYHPTQKPVPLLEDLIKTFSNPGDTVVDLTAGSGSTAVACVPTKRKFVVIEMNLDYYNTIRRRVNQIETQYFDASCFEQDTQF